MNYLNAENVSKTYGDQVLFADFTLSLNKGQKVGLIARNGTGKTSLLRILTGKDSSHLGGTMRWHKGIRIGYLEQDPALSPNDTIFEAVVSSEHPAFPSLTRLRKRPRPTRPTQQRRFATSLRTSNEPRANP